MCKNIWRIIKEEFSDVFGKKVVVKTAWDKFAEVTGRGEDGDYTKTKPSYEQIYLAYARCFKKHNSVYYVGNHRLVEGFTPARVVAGFSLFKKAGRQLPLAVCQAGQGYVITVVGAGVVLNSNIPQETLNITIKNLAKELDREYKKNLADVLLEAEP